MTRFTKSAAIVLCAAVLISNAQENSDFESEIKVSQINSISDPVLINVHMLGIKSHHFS